MNSRHVNMLNILKTQYHTFNKSIAKLYPTDIIPNLLIK